MVINYTTSGSETYRIIIDGGATYTNDVATAEPTKNRGTGNLIQADGTLTLNKVTLRFAYKGSAISASNGGSTARTITYTGGWLRCCRNGAGPAILFQGSDYHNATITNVEIYNCCSTDTDYGGTIRENGGVTHVFF